MSIRASTLRRKRNSRSTTGRNGPADAPLRQGMSNIRSAVAKDAKAIHARKATPKQYEALAEKVTNEVAGIVQNCKLDPHADAQLHIVIAELMAGAEAMEGEAHGVTRQAGAERVAKAPKRAIASQLNLSAEHLSRILRELMAHGLIEVSARRVRIPDVGRLRDWAHGDAA
jgi:hypothetical protein